MRDVSMNRYLIAGQIMEDEETVALVNRQFLHQRCANAHGHSSDHLAAGRFGVEAAPGRAYGENPSHADFCCCSIDTNLDKMRAESGRLISLGEIAIFDSVLADQVGVTGRLHERHAAIAGADLTIDEDCFVRVETKLLRHCLS